MTFNEKSCTVVFHQTVSQSTDAKARAAGAGVGGVGAILLIGGAAPVALPVLAAGVGMSLATKGGIKKVTSDKFKRSVIKLIENYVKEEDGNS